MTTLPPLLRRSSASRSGRSFVHIPPALIMHEEPDFPGMPRRLSSTLPNAHRGGVQEEYLINQLEAEEERLVLLLTRKLEKVRSSCYQCTVLTILQLRQDKARSQNEMEAENESMVLKLSKQLSVLVHSSSASEDPASLQARVRQLQKHSEDLQNRLTAPQNLNKHYKQELIILRKQSGPYTSRPPYSHR